MSAAKPKFSVIIPTRNRGAMLAETIASVRAQQFPSDAFEIIVVDDGSTDGTQERVSPFLDRKLPLVRYVRQNPLGLNAGRNHGLREAKADFIVFTDDDVEVPSHWLAAYEEGFAKFPDAGVLGGPVYPRLEGDTPRPRTCGGCGTLEEMEAFDRGSADMEVHRVIGANFGFNRRLVEEVGTFNEQIPCWQGDESEWFLRVRRAERSIIYIARTGLWHRRSTDDVCRMIALRKYNKAISGVWYARETGGGLPSPLKTLSEMVRWTYHRYRARCFLGAVHAAVHRGALVGWVQWIFLKKSNPGHNAQRLSSGDEMHRIPSAHAISKK